jgi:hypothetical protein
LPAWLLRAAQELLPSSWADPDPDPLDLTLLSDVNQLPSLGALGAALASPLVAAHHWLFRPAALTDCALYHQRTNALFVFLHNPLQVLLSRSAQIS